MEDRCRDGHTVYEDAEGREITEAEFKKTVQPNPGAEANDASSGQVTAEREVVKND